MVLKEKQASKKTYSLESNFKYMTTLWTQKLILSNSDDNFYSVTVARKM